MRQAKGGLNQMAALFRFGDAALFEGSEIELPASDIPPKWFVAGH